MPATLASLSYPHCSPQAGDDQIAAFQAKARESETPHDPSARNRVCSSPPGEDAITQAAAFLMSWIARLSIPKPTQAAVRLNPIPGGSWHQEFMKG